jgi:D-3-phosphoglycerate dehydrogenase / 2-oxoglutarate reductase
MKILCVGDAVIPGADFVSAAHALGAAQFVVDDWEMDPVQLQRRNRLIEQSGPGIEPVPRALREHPDAEMMLGQYVPVSAEGMEAAPNLRLVGIARGGTENVDVAAASTRGILVVNVQGRNAEAVADFTVGLLLCEARNIARAHAALKSGVWRKEFSNSAHVPELRGKTIGIVGFGAIGRLVAKKLSGFDVRLLVYDPFIPDDAIVHAGARPATKHELFAQADFVTLHARLTDDSRRLVGLPELSLMKPTAYLINTARAGLVDTDALVTVLRNRSIAGAGLDVFDAEPIPKEHPLLDLDNVTLTPHLAFATREALTRSPELLVAEVDRILNEGQSRALRNPELLSSPAVKEWIQRARTGLGQVRGAVTASRATSP